MRHPAFLIASVLVAAAVAACGNGNDPCEGHSHDPACLVCDGSEDPLTPGSMLTASNGYAIELVSATPTPFTNGNNTLTVRVRKDGNLVDGIDWTGTQTWYPQGGHGSPLLPTVTPGASGEYTLTNVNFLHAGHWELRFALASAGDTSSYAMPLCIEEAPGA